ncbi:Succinate dehydrogenase [ubiquinone] flavoprotein subunit 1, mitochondrial [Vitis vinifera]|uniref:Succinate dehydrogenase [ubiquinone] flavoprotein subunit 1, mitochondrial n=1 Tax=Vitis vinifera TaxID=29760 RepID=A0A438CHI3_VITVI|nr:Succinate dehydrogenase [ubiquinone] flavoprotein subunit 1, mitochondrial [Vitis vinifera]
MASRPSHPSSPSPNFLYWENEKVRLDYRPVHMNPLDDEIESIPPKARVY